MYYYDRIWSVRQLASPGSVRMYQVAGGKSIKSTELCQISTNLQIYCRARSLYNGNIVARHVEWCPGKVTNNAGGHVIMGLATIWCRSRPTHNSPGQLATISARHKQQYASIKLRQINTSTRIELKLYFSHHILHIVQRRTLKIIW